MFPDSYFVCQDHEGKWEKCQHHIKEGEECDMEEDPSTQEERKQEEPPTSDPSATQGGEIKCPLTSLPL